MTRKFSSIALLFLFIIFVLPFQSLLAGEPASIFVDSAAIACSEPQAARTGLEVLRQGGNAMDALITVAFSMAVTYPRAGNIGGGGFIVYRTHRGEVFCIDFREKAPLAATADMYLDENGQPVPERSLVGALAVGVPGTVKGLYLAHQKFATLPWKRLLQPAIKLAKEGMVVDSSLSRSLAAVENQFRQFPYAYSIFYPDQRVPQPGEKLRQTDLARTLQVIAEQGADGFYQGEVARKLVSSIQSHGGIITLEDLQQYEAVERQPVEISYRGYTIYSMPPPSSGGLTLQGILYTLQRVSLSEKFVHNSADYIALLSEIEKHWFARRNLYLGDPDFVDIPYELFRSPIEIQNILNLVSVEHPYPSRQVKGYREILVKEHPNTTHISIVDAEGNAVAMTYTLNGSYGSFLMAEGTGILLNNEMDDFTTAPGKPNMFGLVQGEANAIAPGKRMLSSMTPTIVEKDGQLRGVLGTPGGSRIITTVLQVLLNKIDYGMSLEEAVRQPRFHHQWLPDTIFYEQERFPETILKELEHRGFRLVSFHLMGDVQAIWRAEDSWEVCSDFRGAGKPVGF